MICSTGGKPVHIPTSIENGFKITAEQLERAITLRTKLLIICSPCNPTGAVYSQEELDSLVEVILRHENIYVISDEIYEHLNYIGQHASIAENRICHICANTDPVSPIGSQIGRVFHVETGKKLSHSLDHLNELFNGKLIGCGV